MGLGTFIHDLVAPSMEAIAPLMPGETFPIFFETELKGQMNISVQCV